MHYTIKEVFDVTGGEAFFNGELTHLDEVGFDSRRIGNPRATLFFCLKGRTQSGVKFVGDAYAKGVRNFVVEAPFNHDEFKQANFILVDEALTSLQQLAAFHRKKFRIPVIGITGSNGKTIVKEWLFHLLKSDFVIARSPRSYNSGLGVAISLLGIDTVHNLAIIEAGISEPGEMNVLEKMISPSLGIFTHLGSAHDENFENLSQKAHEKVQLFVDSDVVVYPYDSEEVRTEIQRLKGEKPLLQTISWGWKEGAKFRISSVDEHGSNSLIKFSHRSVSYVLEIPFKDQASVENAMSCLCAMQALERWDPEHLEIFKELHPLENRLSFFEGKNENYVVNDSYSNDVDSLQVALDFMMRQQPGKEHVVLLSDLEQSEPDKRALYKKVAQLLREKGTSELLGVGDEIAKHKELFEGIRSTFYVSKEALKQAGVLDTIHGKAILIKGARRFGLELIARDLRRQLHQTVLEIDLNALRNNFSWFRQKLHPGVKMMAMVKAFGYGSGSFEAARTLQFMGADYLAVAFVDEGVALRRAGIHIPIMVMNTGVEDMDALLANNLEPVIFNKKGIHDFAAAGGGLNVHIEMDTGMHRLGFNAADLTDSFANFPSNLHVLSVFSHLSAAESEEHDEFTGQQISTFLDGANQIEKALGYTVLRHIANTGGILRWPQAHFDMVRLGIGLYGIDPTGNNIQGPEPVASLKTSISQIRLVAAGDSIGYSRKARENRERRIATLPIGYADGIFRKMGNGNGGVFIQGKIAPFVGNICMDMCMVDVSGVACNEGDMVEIFGKNLSIETVAIQCETIAYEILTSVSQRVRREYTGEN